MKKKQQFKSRKENINGVILLDKPTGVSSNQALQKVKWLYQARKAGHTGSLDPLATGLLPLCFGQATKVSQYLLDSHKKYTTVIKLGEVTDTLDSEGEVTKIRPVNVSDDQIQNALEQFKGDIKQVPPMYSALKKDGQPLYKLARKGEVIERPARDMTVHGLTAERIDEVHVRLRVHCSSGFYIRSLAFDLGETLGCGAHVVELRRTDIKSLAVEQAYSIADIEQAKDIKSLLLPIDSLLQEMPQIEISQQQSTDLLQGKTVSAQGLTTSSLSRFYTPEGKLFAVGEIADSGNFKTHRIFVES